MATSGSLIENKLSRIKDWYRINWPLCVFCNHRLRDGEGDLAHIIRRSWSSNSELQTMKLNTGLAHRGCHDIYDNSPKEAILLPRFLEVQFIAYLISPAYHEAQKPVYGDFFEFPDLGAIKEKYPALSSLEHHGELLYLPEDI